MLLPLLGPAADEDEDGSRGLLGLEERVDEENGRAEEELATQDRAIGRKTADGRFSDIAVEELVLVKGKSYMGRQIVIISIDELGPPDCRFPSIELGMTWCCTSALFIQHTAPENNGLYLGRTCGSFGSPSYTHCTYNRGRERSSRASCDVQRLTTNSLTKQTNPGFRPKSKHGGRRRGDLERELHWYGAQLRKRLSCPILFGTGMLCAHQC